MPNEQLRNDTDRGGTGNRHSRPSRKTESHFAGKQRHRDRPCPGRHSDPSEEGASDYRLGQLFPAHSAPYVTGRVRDPVEIVQAIQAARDGLDPVRFLITGTDLDINVRMGVETFDYEERAGELGDFYYSIKLSEWKDYSPRRIALPAEPEQPAQAKEPERTGEPEAAKAKTYTVKAGDCLWNIAKQLYGKGSDYTKIYNANKGTIGSNPNLIYPGQVFTIP